MKYIVYKITNIINGKIYVGAHKTDNLDDNYMGSGKNIKRAIKKYGEENFKKEFLAVFDNIEDMFKMESEIVNEEFIKNTETYNIVKGGFGGFDYINEYCWTKEERIAHSKKIGRWNDLKKRNKVWNTVSLDFRKTNAKKMGDKFGGLKKLSEEEINNRLTKIKDIDLTQYGWVNKVAEILNLTHTQVRRFIEKYYHGTYYRRK